MEDAKSFPPEEIQSEKVRTAGRGTSSPIHHQNQNVGPIVRKVKTIIDKNGESYQIAISEEGIGPSFDLRFQAKNIQQSFIGRVKFVWEDVTTLRLADIYLKDNAIVIYRRTGLFWWLKKVRREPKNFQRIGLGTALLKYALDYVKQIGVKRVVGKIKAVDYPKNPNLPRWYTSLGFKVTMETEPSALVARISKEL
jgi:hypothetical protein